LSHHFATMTTWRAYRQFSSRTGKSVSPSNNFNINSFMICCHCEYSYFFPRF